MTDVLLRKHLGALRPADQAAEDLLQQMRQGEVIRAKVSRPRNLAHHRKFFALMNLVFENQERYPTVDALVAAFKIAAGHADLYALPSGAEFYIPRSISFAKMDQTEFNAFYDRACDVIAKHFLPGVQAADLKREVEELIGIAHTAA